jgi:hypothetical protein
MYIPFLHRTDQAVNGLKFKPNTGTPSPHSVFKTRLYGSVLFFAISPTKPPIRQRNGGKAAGHVPQRHRSTTRTVHSQRQRYLLVTTQYKSEHWSLSRTRPAEKKKFQSSFSIVLPPQRDGGIMTPAKEKKKADKEKSF